MWYYYIEVIIFWNVLFIKNITLRSNRYAKYPKSRLLDQSHFNFSYGFHMVFPKLTLNTSTSVTRAIRIAIIAITSKFRDSGNPHFFFGSNHFSSDTLFIWLFICLLFVNLLTASQFRKMRLPNSDMEICLRLFI